jgi:DNA replication and repair protein RecF
VITQRNALLKRIREGAAAATELAYWDEELARDGATLLRERAIATGELAAGAADAHARLSGEREQLELQYQPRFADPWPAERIAAAGAEEIATALLDRLRRTQPRDIAAGLTLTGPHRDDLALSLGGEPAAAFASRGQQRTAALALRLAEARLLHARSGERPILLLDDVLSELDESRRATVLAAIDADQVLITSADPDRFDAAYLTAAQVWHIECGVATRA